MKDRFIGGPDKAALWRGKDNTAGCTVRHPYRSPGEHMGHISVRRNRLFRGGWIL